jgi:hypothetical protein
MPAKPLYVIFLALLGVGMAAPFQSVLAQSAGQAALFVKIVGIDVRDPNDNGKRAGDEPYFVDQTNSKCYTPANSALGREMRGPHTVNVPGGQDYMMSKNGQLIIHLWEEGGRKNKYGCYPVSGKKPGSDDSLAWLIFRVSGDTAVAEYRFGGEGGLSPLAHQSSIDAQQYRFGNVQTIPGLRSAGSTWTPPSEFSQRIEGSNFDYTITYSVRFGPMPSSSPNWLRYRH